MYPEEMDFAKLRAFSSGIIHTVPDGLQDTCERGDTNTRTDKNDSLIFLEIFGCGSKRSIDHNYR